MSAGCLAIDSLPYCDDGLRLGLLIEFFRGKSILFFITMLYGWFIESI
jgi:hypothetical protein